MLATLSWWHLQWHQNIIISRLSPRLHLGAIIVGLGGIREHSGLTLAKVPKTPFAAW
ncbi:hypothetical protein DAI22_06g113800 [Oryza sativa Japonica Group]|nr:hypothetical protein DAI22_06g113800 [Oryza sativa Japonica Group]